MRYLEILIHRFPFFFGIDGELFRKLVDGGDESRFRFHGGSKDENAGNFHADRLQCFLHGIDGFPAGENVVHEKDTTINQA